MATRVIGVLLLYAEHAYLCVGIYICMYMKWHPLLSDQHAEIVEVLRARGCNTQAKTINGHLPHHLAAWMGVSVCMRSFT